ncbi:DUF308 domain-containing protein [Candidatus Aciduliprofundum boonei]|uniref:HdeD family acid-resistance protein n=1 Tax=Aciduliprofundum boonei (strain DSM 19572 / T469) TaxID=439481 RepID=B5IGX1_ACIB4|nr:DUF308 domain-containing protein [Candidatus Aciduliprofundum boonei]ADD08695.1 hypothetical protein Aboo_0886 [Aciduliprofundum boonei T469]EDY34440.1 hypothetical protein ABOONEI_852 [Aciduliprofundum boonei T469]EDY34482.1 hypothetical protein ABOONEI_1456 [Aciduliprofundum boonei T469]HII54878.1 hypothetical protein [Candidatus Aciduliprofundum boonei]
MISKLDYRIEDAINSHTITGIFLVLIGIFAVFFPLYFSFALIYVVGILLIILGLIGGFLYFTTLGKEKMRLIGAIVMITLGLIDLLSPILGLKIFTVIIILFFLFAAFTNFMLARSIKSQAGSWLAIGAGILTLIFDALLILGWKSYLSFVFIGLFVGVVLFMDGLVFLFQGYRIGKIQKFKK